MKAVQAQFAVRRGPGALLWGIVLLGAAAAVALQWQTHRLAEQDHLERLAAEQRALEQAAKAERSAGAPVPFAESLNEIRQLRTVQWPQLLAALEVTPRGELQAVSLEVDVVARSASISATASSLSALTDYAHALRIGAPESGAAWRFSVERVAEREADGMSAQIRASWESR
jgi:hypothetical protein